jgi:hypothetical protein
MCIIAYEMLVSVLIFMTYPTLQHSAAAMGVTVAAGVVAAAMLFV